MIGKVDLVMWAKNGENVLPTVLKRIDEVIPTKLFAIKLWLMTTAPTELPKSISSRV
jgi:hypothetical protein